MTKAAEEIVCAKRISPSTFDSAICHFDGIVQEGTVQFAAARWPATTLEPWIYDVGRRPAAAALVMVQPLPVRSGQLAVVKWGPVLADETAATREAVHEAAVSHLVREYAEDRGMTLSIIPHAERDPPLRAADRLWARGFRKGSSLLYPNRYMVNVRLTDQELRQSFQQKWRYHLNKSERQGLAFEVTEAAALPRFQALYEAMAERKRFPDYSAYHTLPSLMDWPVAALRPQLFFITHGGADVAGAAIFTAGRTAVYLYGATNARALDLRAGYFMHARIISWLRDHTKAAWYDLGGTDGFQGLHQFKKGMAGARGRIAPVPPIANFAISLRARITGDAAYAARDGYQKVRAVANRIRYRDMARPDQDRDT